MSSRMRRVKKFFYRKMGCSVSTPTAGGPSATAAVPAVPSTVPDNQSSDGKNCKPQPRHNSSWGTAKTSATTYWSSTDTQTEKRQQQSSSVAPPPRNKAREEEEKKATTMTNKKTVSSEEKKKKPDSPPQLEVVPSQEEEEPPPPAKEVVLPCDPNFRYNVNGTNGYTVDDIYMDSGIELGRGNFGWVYKATHKFHDNNTNETPSSTWREVAIKTTTPNVLDYKNVGRMKYYEDVEKRCQEVRTLLKLRKGTVRESSSPVLYLYEYFWKFDKFSGKGRVFLVTELLGQELDEWLQQKFNNDNNSNYGLDEMSAKEIAAVVLNSLIFIHSRDIVHRDMNPQNLLFRINGDFRTLKVVDFGLSRDLSTSKKDITDFCGRLGYIAPEIYRREAYRTEVDMFAFGVILYILLSGSPPFASKNPDKIQGDTTGLKYKLTGPQWDGISEEALDLIQKLLVRRERRLTAEQAMMHAWFF